MADLELFFKLMWYLFLLALIVWVTVWSLTLAGFFLIFLIKSKLIMKRFPEYFINANPQSLVLPSVLCAGVLWLGSISTSLIISYTLYNDPAGFSRIEFETLTSQAVKFAITLWLSWVLSIMFEKAHEGQNRVLISVGASAIIGAVFVPWPVVLQLNYFASNWTAVPAAVIGHAVESVISPIAVTKSVILGTMKDWTHPFHLVWQIVKYHNGDQFELARYYPSMMIVIIIGSIIAGPFEPASSGPHK